MLLTDVTTKTVRDRTPLAFMIGAGLAVLAILFAVLAASLEEELTQLTADLPEALSSIMGGAGSNYVVSELFGLLAPIAVLVVAISAGTNALAREEDGRTADLLLTQPVTRRGVVRSKATVMVGDLLMTCCLLLAGSLVGASMVDVVGLDVAGAVAATVHVFFLGLAFGMIALAVSNLTGSGPAGLGVTVGLAVVANLVAGLVPLVEGAEGWASVSPWYWFNGSQPLANGVAVGDLAALAALAAAAYGFAWWVVEHRDIRSGRMAHRIAIPALGRFMRPRIGTVFAKTLTDRVTLLTVIGFSMVVMAVTVSAMYHGIKDSLAGLTDALPAAFDELLGSADMSTPTGWIQGELLSIMTPMAIVAVGMTIGLNAIAGEDARRTLGLVLATPMSRSRLVLESAAALVVAVALLSSVTWVGLVLGSVLAGLDVSSAKLAAAMVHQGMLGVFFGVFTLTTGAAFDKSTALRVSLAVVVVSYFANWLFALRASLDRFTVIFPWHYATDNQPLYDGLDLGALAVLAAATMLSLLAAVALFDRREVAG